MNCQRCKRRKMVHGGRVVRQPLQYGYVEIAQPICKKCAEDLLRAIIKWWQEGLEPVK